MSAEMRSALRAWVQRALVAVGVVCLVSYSVITVHTWRYQRAAKSEIDRIASVERARPVAAAADATRPVKPLATGELIGKVEIPRLGLSAAVAEGDDDKTLRKAVGHLPDTPLPWHRQGNVALAAHRDGLFRRLENIRLDDEVRMVTPRGDFQYRVTKTHIVDPGDVWVIAPTAVPTITLITCYPFSFVGNAPRRFVVQAQLVQKELGGTPLKGSVVR
jgi:sortase A